IGLFKPPMNFLFFHTITQNEKLLIAWVKHFYPNYQLSFSGPGWVTFKAPSPATLLKDLRYLDCPLALQWGFGLDIIKIKSSEELVPTLVEKISTLSETHH